MKDIALGVLVLGALFLVIILVFALLAPPPWPDSVLYPLGH